MSSTGARRMTVVDERQRARQAIQRAEERADGSGLLEAVQQLLALGATPAEVSFAAGRLRAIGAEGARRAGLLPLRVFCARSVTIEPILPHLIVHGARRGLWLSFTVGGYGSFAQELTSPTGPLAQSRPELVMLLSDQEDLVGDLRAACAGGLPEEVATVVEDAGRRLTGLLETFRRHSTAPLLVQGLLLPDRPVLGEVMDANMPEGEGWAIRRINEVLAGACRAAGDAVLFNQDQVAARCGRERWRDQRLWRGTRLPVAGPCFDAYARGLVRALRPLLLPARKVLVTDLDNTLWGGVVGEDGPDGVATGSDFPGNCYQDYQRLLGQLARRGVLLALASKNNPSDVKECFERRRRDLLLGLEDFVAAEIGWGPKADSLKRIAQTLNLGLDSLVFVDDSPVECAEIRQSLPQVEVIQVSGKEPWRIAAEVGDQLEVFDQLTVSEDDRKRLRDYQDQRLRAELRASVGSPQEFLASLGMVCTVLSALEAPLARTVQLLAKTNQFNLTSRRHSAGAVERLAAEPGSQAWALRLRDRFGDAGVVGVALCRAQGRLCVIDSFLLSCRVIGRGVETSLLRWIAQSAISSGASHLIGEYVPTAKNALCASFYPDHGFSPFDSTLGPIDGTSGTLYQLDLGGGPPALPSWISLETNP